MMIKALAFLFVFTACASPPRDPYPNDTILEVVRDELDRRAQGAERGAITGGMKDECRIRAERKAMEYELERACREMKR